jgi:hypothetical protein
MISKIIHYCWFGPNDFPDLEKKCMETWKKLKPEYEFMFWNEDTFDINSVPYVREAYKKGKYAFVSDYVRMYALYNYGGIYLDTDVEVIDKLEEFLNNIAFIGFENRTMIGTGIIGAEKKSKLFKEMLKYYQKHHFIDKKGNIDTTTNVQIISRILSGQGFIPQNSEQILEQIHIYPRDVFCPKKMDDGTFDVSDRTVTIHHFAGSWLTEREKKRGTSKIWRNICRPILKSARRLLEDIIGKDATKKIENSIRKRLR